jgi:hypothetical protein
MIRWDRLEILAKKMREVAEKQPQKFDIRSWMAFEAEVTEGWDDRFAPLPEDQVVEKRATDGYAGAYDERHIAIMKPNFCGTTACVLGWAATMPEFNEHGLMVELTDYIEIDEADEHIISAREGDVILKRPNARTLNGMDAGAAFFGLTYDEAKVMFAVDLDETHVEWYTFGYEREDELENGQVTAAMVAARLEAACAAKDLGM